MFTKCHPLGIRQIVFSGIDKWKYTSKDCLLFSYRINNEKWSSYENKTTVFLTGLIPGKHQFEVRAMDRNWNVDPTPAFFEFTVVQPWVPSMGLYTLFIDWLLDYLICAHLRHLPSY